MIALGHIISASDQHTLGTASLDTTLYRAIADDLTSSCCHLYGFEGLEPDDVLASKAAFLPPLFAEEQSLLQENWYHEHASKLASPFNGVEMDIILKASEDDDKRFSTRGLIELELDEIDCCDYFDHLILERTFSTSISQAADYFKLPLTMIKGLVLMNHLPTHAFPGCMFMSRAMQQGLFEAYLSELPVPVTHEESPSLSDLPEGVRPYMSEDGVVVYPSPFKMLVLQKILNENCRVSEIAKLYDLNTSLIGNWRRAYRNNRPVDTSKSQAGHCTKSIIKAYKQLLSDL